MNLIFSISPLLCILALISGSMFGFFLQKSGATRFDVIINQLRLKDFTIMKIMLTAISIGSFLLYSFDSIGWIPLFRLSKIPALYTALGGGIFGIGMSLSGYCPGTMIAAIADGAKDMKVGFIGMLIGSAIFNKLYPVFYSFLTEKDIFFQETLPSYFNISPFYFIAGFFLILFTLLFVTKKPYFKKKPKLKAN